MFDSLRSCATAAWLLLLTLPSCVADETKKASDFAIEVGPAKYLRSDVEALANSKKSGKPVFAFFQEVPG